MLATKTEPTFLDTCKNIRKQHIRNILATVTRIDEIDPIVDNIQALSPKKMGVFTESFLKAEHQITPSDSIYYDGIDENGKKVEVKASRALIDTHAESEGEDNLLDILSNERRELASVFTATEHKIMCNIQQIKPKEFDTLYYSILFNDYIFEFKISSKEILKIYEGVYIKKEIMKIKQQVEINYPDIDQIFNDFLTRQATYENVKTVLNDYQDIQLFKSVLKAIETRKVFRYSNKQHKGNTNEGQLHLTNHNFMFHVANYLNAVYTYDHFKTVLSGIKK